MSGESPVGEAFGPALAGGAQESAGRPRETLELAQSAARGTTVMLTGNDYLDARESVWLTAERAGQIVYDPTLRMVRVLEPIASGVCR